MIKAVMGASPSMADKTALVLKDNAGVAMDPALVGASGPAILEVWFPGQEDGHITADLLFGAENPSGKSPFTYPYDGKGFLDHLSTRQFPGEVINGQPTSTVEYTERLNIGYRWYDANVSGSCPTAADGNESVCRLPLRSRPVLHRLPDLQAQAAPRVTDGTKPITVKLFVENTGDRAGAEVVQVYLRLPNPPANRPSDWSGSRRSSCSRDEKKHVTITIDPSASHHPMSVWDAEADAWTTPEGTFDVYVGNSSGNVTLAETVKVRTPGRPGH